MCVGVRVCVRVCVCECMPLEYISHCRLPWRCFLFKQVTLTSSSSVSPPTLPLLSLVKIMMLPGAARVVEDVVPPPSGATAANPTGEGVRCRW